jgi:uroporphyrinogen decarboxylase
MSEPAFIAACYGRNTGNIPVWFMRQAGRSLPGYRKLREKYGVLELAQTPELAAQVSMEPIERLGVDAAILFADIMLLPMALGVDVKIVDGVGPVIDSPIDSAEKIDALLPFDVERIAYLLQTITILRGELKVPLIGFSGAPFTLASYMIEGKPTRTWTKTKRFMYERPEAWEKLMTVLSDAIIGYLQAQIGSGAQAVQLFDSWAGCLSPADYRTRVLPYVQKIFSALSTANVPRLHFATDTAGMLSDFSNVDCEVIGLDWRVELAATKKAIGAKAMQGNLDPAILLAPWDTITAKIDELIASVSAREGYIFNLGHGVFPETDDGVVRKVVEYVHGK